MSDLENALARLPEVKAVVFDLDHTLHEGYIATSIYRGLFKRKPKIATKATFGMFRGAHAALFTRAGKAERVKKLLDGINSLARIPKPLAFMLAEARIRTKPIKPTRKILSAAQKAGIPVFLVTNGPDIGPIIYSKIYRIRDWLANPVIYDSHSIKSFDLVVRPSNVARKVNQLLALHDIRPRDCMVVADNKYYVPLMRRAKVAVASPSASKAVRKIADYQL